MCARSICICIFPLTFPQREVREGTFGTERAFPRLLLHANPVCVSVPRLDNDWHNLAEEWREILATQQEEDDDCSDSEVKSDRKKDRRDDTRRQRREQRVKSRGKGLAREDKHAP